ncbi:MAG: hypothetical protein JOS17DRAFT_829451 [Linnemannia elongata]|nr:MAG: hypothetical protein JOS17DRAFT_829451 [Linnemannia elongata]
MKVTLILAAVIAASSVSAYQCPDTASINSSCRQISVSPLVCNNPNVNKDACNSKQCNQAYIDNYSACQCRRSPNMFYQHSVNVEGLLRRCGLSTLSNPYGSLSQYRPGQGAQVFGPITSATSSATSGVVTRIYNGTTYYGGSNTVISGTTHWVGATVIQNGTRINGATTWISGTPSIIRSTATHVAPVPGTTVVSSPRSAAPIESPTGTPVPVQSQGKKKLSGGAIAGVVLGCLAVLALAGLLAWCWRRKRNQHASAYNTHSTYDDQNRGPTRTTVTEKIEPVVVKSDLQQQRPRQQLATYTTTQSVPANQSSNTVHPSTSYNTTTTTGYNTANNGYNSASNTYNNGYNTANDVRNNARGTH